MLLRWFTPGMALISGLLLTLLRPGPGPSLQVTLDQAPRRVEVGVPFSVGFTIYELPANQPRAGLAPLVVARNPATRQTVTVAAWPEAASGHYAAKLILPASGEWEWSIHPDEHGVYPPVSLHPLQAQPPAVRPALPPELALLGLLLLACVPLLAVAWIRLWAWTPAGSRRKEAAG